MPVDPQTTPEINVIETEHGWFCSVCQSQLSLEESDFGVCDACGGEGIGDDDDEG
jgi:Zn finger protein HypA/HybF involved in hydrogenase expression